VQADIWGDGPLAEAARLAAASLGWTPGGTDLVAVAPLASTVAECDALIAREIAGRRAFAWPTISVPAVQQMIVRCSGIGAVTDLSTRSTRPAGTDFLVAVHDQVALVVLLAQLTGLGAPTGATLHSPTSDVERLVVHFGDFRATAEVAWSDAAPTLDIQLAAAADVLRIETDPVTRLEHNGAVVPLPGGDPTSTADPTANSNRDQQLYVLRETGVIGMLRSIGDAFDDGRPLAHAFSFEFGRTVVALVERARPVRDRGPG